MAECNNEIKKAQEVVALRKQQSEQVKKEKEEKAAAAAEAAEAAAAAVPKYVDCIMPAVEAEPLYERTLDVASEGGAEMPNKKLKTGVSALLYNTHMVIRDINAGAQFFVCSYTAAVRCLSVCLHGRYLQFPSIDPYSLLSLPASN